MKCLGRALLILVAIAIVVAIVWYVLSQVGVEITADLAAMKDQVQRLDARASRQEVVPSGEHRKLHTDDQVTVDGSGRAQIKSQHCTWEVFRDTALRAQKLASASDPVCVGELKRGTLYARVEVDSKVNADWAVVRAVGTRFLVHLDPGRGLLWVVVLDGVVEVETAAGVEAVGPGEQTWASPGQPPEPPRPARRGEVGDLFPPVEELTNGEMGDGDVLLPERRAPVTEPLGLRLAQSTDEVIAGECAGPHTLEVTAYLTGDDEALANAARAVIRYQWEGSDEQFAEMERMDDRTWMLEIGPFDYCCQQTMLVYTVEVFDASGQVLAAEGGEVLLSYCIG